MAKETIIVFCAHNDDQIIGAGGTLSRYSKEGKKVITVIFSYGEGSHPWLKRKEIIHTRVKESIKTKKILGEEKLIFLGLRENNFKEDFIKKDVKKKIIKLITKYCPSKIFTHSIDDPHPDHKDIYNLITGITSKIDYKGHLFSFDVWNPINLRKRNSPRLVVDISKTFKNKIKAIKLHKSQKFAMFSLLWVVYSKAIINGLDSNCMYAEVFYKIR